MCQLPSSASPIRSSLCLLTCATLLCALSLAAQDFSHPDTERAPDAGLIQKANDAIAGGDLQSALSILATLNTKSPNNPQVLYDLGLTLEAIADASTPNTKQPAPATTLTPEACYRQAIAADPTFAAPHVALGLLLARTSHPSDATRQLAGAVALPNIDPALKARALRALARLDLNGDPQHPNPSAASDDLIGALKLSPEQPSDVLLSAEIAEASSDFPSAESAYRRYLALPGRASDPQATAALAHVLLAEDHPADAEALLTPALSAHPDNPSFTAQLAQAWLDSGDPAKSAKAVPLLEKLHTQHPEEHNVARLLARVYVETGHPEQAEPIYASLIAVAGDHPDPTLLDARAETLLRLRRPAEAEKLLKQAVVDKSAFPSSEAYGDATLHLAFAASEIDDPKTTLQALELRATVQQPSPSSLFLEATANDALHQSSKAAELYKQFLSAAAGKFPDQEYQARQRLAELIHAK